MRLSKLLIENDCPICGHKRFFRITTISFGTVMAYLRMDCEACSHPKEMTMSVKDWWKFCSEPCELEATEVVDASKH